MTHDPKQSGRKEIAETMALGLMTREFNRAIEKGVDPEELLFMFLHQFDRNNEHPLPDDARRICEAYLNPGKPKTNMTEKHRDSVKSFDFLAEAFLDESDNEGRNDSFAAFAMFYWFIRGIRNESIEGETLLMRFFRLISVHPEHISVNKISQLCATLVAEVESDKGNEQ